MGKSTILFGVILGLVFSALPAQAMESAPIRLKTWRHGESIDGEEFHAATEQIVDYVASLKHPEGMLDSITYNCTGKARELQLSVQKTGTTPAEWVYSTMVYELKDCVEAK